MTDRVDGTTSTDLNGLAEVMEGIGIAIMGALCGLFVAAMVAKADIEEINSLPALFCAMLYGAVGFYLRTNLPSLSSSVTFSTDGTGPKTNPIALTRALGTFVAAAAALVSVYMIIFDERPPAIWNVGIGIGWAFGVLLQFATGTAARLRQYGRSAAKPSGRAQAG
jgi:glycerol uptake facilitator-like aquaporin